MVTLIRVARRKEDIYEGVKGELRTDEDKGAESACVGIINGCNSLKLEETNYAEIYFNKVKSCTHEQFIFTKLVSLQFYENQYKIF